MPLNSRSGPYLLAKRLHGVAVNGKRVHCKPRTASRHTDVSHNVCNNGDDSHLMDWRPPQCLLTEVAVSSGQNQTRFAHSASPGSGSCPWAGGWEASLTPTPFVTMKTQECPCLASQLSQEQSVSELHRWRCRQYLVRVSLVASLRSVRWPWLACEQLLLRLETAEQAAPRSPFLLSLPFRRHSCT